MAHRTTKRAGMYVDTSSIAKQNKQSIESVVAYKGFADNKNNIANPQDSFVDLQNMYIDDDELLSTRAPVKISGGVIVNKLLGLYNVNNYIFKIVSTEDTLQIVYDETHYKSISTSSTRYKDIPKILFAPIEDRIFIFVRYKSSGEWKNDLLVFDVYTKNIIDGIDDLYVPIRYLVTNGFMTEYENNNYLIDRYRTRYLYSASSSVDFAKLEGESIEVLDHNNADKFLYEAEGTKDFNFGLLYPYAEIDEPDYFEVIERGEGQYTYLCYYRNTNIVKVSIDGKYWMAVSETPTILPDNLGAAGVPRLSKDGANVCAFAADGVYIASVLYLTETNYLKFERQDYWNNAPMMMGAIGYFLTADAYVYAVRSNTNVYQYCAHWYQSGAAQEYKSADDSSAIYNIAICLYEAADNKGPVICIQLYNAYKFAFLQTDGTWGINTIYYTFADTIYRTIDFRLSSSPNYYGTSADIYFICSYEINGGVSVKVERKYFDRAAIDNTSATITWNWGGVTDIIFSEEEDWDIILSDKGFYLGASELIETNSKLSIGYGNYGGSIAGMSFVEFPILFVSTKIALAGLYVWAIKDGVLWTTTPSTDHTLALDIYNEDDTVLRDDINIPTHFASLEEHYFSFENKLGITETRHNEDNKFLLYIPVNDMQVYIDAITNLYPISTTTMAVFLQDSVWYTSVLNDETRLLYKRPIKSKLPFGCKEGIQIMTLADGQSIVFPTDRGLALLGPQDFVATTDPIIKYISDDIQNFYLRYYSDTVRTAEVALVTGVKFNTYFERPLEIKSCIYRYWLLIYKRYSNIVLIYDMRKGTWWKWKMPYPIVDLIVDDGVAKMALYIIDAVEGTLDPTGQTITYDYTSDFGVLYQLDDKNANILLDEQRFPRIAEGFDDYDYSDEVIPGTLDGIVTDVTDQYSGQSYQEYHLAQSRIDWYGLSQKLYLGSINNYKAIRGINIVARGLYDTKALLEVKIFRDVFHPEESLTMNMYIEDLRAFVQRLNLMHVIFFQFRISNPDNDEKQKQVHIASVSIKYEMKEGIR